MTRALPGDTVTLTGNGYAANSAITLSYTSTDPTIVPPVTGTFSVPVTTNGTGSFTTSIVIPGILTNDYDTYIITAVDSATPAELSNCQFRHRLFT
jgi:hypothetical protein